METRIKKLLLGLAITTAGIGAYPGAASADDFAVGTMTVLSSIGDENDIYYPIVTADEHEDLFPMVVLLPGGKSDKASYSGYATEMAKRGYVMAIGNHWRPLGPPGTAPQLFASVNAMVSSMELLQSLDAEPTSPLYKIIDSETLGVQGHSFGGGAALWAVEGSCGYFNVFCDSRGPAGPVPYYRPAELKAAVLWGTNSWLDQGPYPTLLDPYTAAAPVALFTGANDQIATLTKALDTYPLLDGTRAVLEFEGMTHYGICDVEDPASNTPDQGEPEISQQEGQRRIARWADRFFKANLYGHHGMISKIYDKQQGDNGVTILSSELVE